MVVNLVGWCWIPMDFQWDSQSYDLVDTWGLICLDSQIPKQPVAPRWSPTLASFSCKRWCATAQKGNLLRNRREALSMTSRLFVYYLKYFIQEVWGRTYRNDILSCAVIDLWDDNRHSLLQLKKGFQPPSRGLQIWRKYTRQPNLGFFDIQSITVFLALQQFLKKALRPASWVHQWKLNEWHNCGIVLGDLWQNWFE